ncbi:hypothetical protein EO763_10905 [Pectobacterium odoriferum]|nr:hypothetical protein EO763_10905 [Pectobacterium odoriferum]
MRDILSLTEGQPLAGQIRSRRICPSLAACLKRELFSVCHYKKQKTAIARLQRLYCSMYITPITSLTVMDDAGGDNAYQSV